MVDQSGIAGTAAPIWAPRKLVVCCDGTWNEPYQIGNPTNIVKMVRAILPKDTNEVAQIVFYHPGVGTGNIFDRFIGGTMGVGLAKNVQSAYEFLAANYVDGERIYLFGFSRGAYTARSLAGLIGQVGGLLRKSDMDLFPFVFDIYRNTTHRAALGTKVADQIEAAIRAVIPSEKLGNNLARLVTALAEARAAPIFFIGVWDTVGALGVPAGGLRFIGKSYYDFHDTALSEHIRFAYHALAIDERRKRRAVEASPAPSRRHLSRFGFPACTPMLAAATPIADCPTSHFSGWSTKPGKQQETATAPPTCRSLLTKTILTRKPTAPWASSKIRPRR